MHYELRINIDGSSYRFKYFIVYFNLSNVKPTQEKRASAFFAFCVIVAFVAAAKLAAVCK